MLAPGLEPVGQGAAARTLAFALANHEFRVNIGVVGRIDNEDIEDLASAGFAVERVSIRHLLDVAGARRLRQFVRDCRPDIIHAWGATAVRAARSVVSRDGMGGNEPRLIVSGASEPGGGLGGRLAARRVRRADRVIPCTRAEGDRYRRLGVPAEQLTLIAPAAPTDQEDLDAESVHRDLGIPPDARLIAASGHSEKGFGPRDAIIAFDMLRYEHEDLHLVILGAGPETPPLERLARSLAFDDLRVHFVERTTQLAAASRIATAVFAVRPRLGVEDALEGMAAGKPVIGWATPDLAEIVEDKATGLLVPLGDRAALAASMRAVLENPSHARRLGDAGRARAAEHFGFARMVEQFVRLYREIAPPAYAADRREQRIP